MKKLALAFATLLVLSACGKNDTTSTQAPQTSDTASSTTPTTSQTPTPTKQRKAEHYAVATTPDLPPFSFKDEYGLVIGFDIDVLQAIADDQNFSFDMISAPFTTLFDDLAKDKYQILAATLTPTPERQAKYEMSKPYVWAGNIIMGKEGGTVLTVADIGENKIAVANQSYSHELLTKSGIKNIVVKDKLYVAYGAFIRGEADYVIGDAGALNHYHTGSGIGDTVKIYTATYDKNEDARASFAVQKGNTALVEKINTGLTNIRANGKYDEIYKKWFGDDQSLKVPADKL